MPTMGYRGTCPKCGSERMEGEYRSAQYRGECPDCGLFYESGITGWVAEAYELTVPDDADEIDARAWEALRAEHWFQYDGGIMRVGYIRKDEESRGAFHVINTWFAVPAMMYRRPTAIDFVHFSDEEAAAFDESEWFLRRS